MKQWSRRAVAAAVVVLIFPLAGCSRDDRAGVYKTAKVTRDNLMITIDATGTLEPEEVVDVGAQVAGQILEFGADADGKPVDYGSRVEQGTVLARIDEALSQADVAQAEAQVKSAQAGIQRSEADLEQLKAKLTQAQRDWERAKKLGPSEALAQATYDGYESAYETAKANIAVGEASILQAKAGLTQAETSLWRAKRNLGYCTITSPVNGIVIDRRVNIGQTVVSSLNAPSLFLIAKDLRRMEIWVAVNEADIARIRAGQPVTFTVDALPGDTFRGEVNKVRLNASMTQNVVTYTVEITADNPDGRLLPYMTASVKFEVGKRENVLQVPVAALRWTPPTEPGAAAPPADAAKVAASTVWTVRNGQPQSIAVKAGLTSDVFTEIEGEGIAEGLEVITGMQTAADAAAETNNPFTIKLPARGGRPHGR